MTENSVTLPETNPRFLYTNNNGIIAYTNILFDGSNNHIFFIERQIQNATMPYSNNQYPLMKNIIKYMKSSDIYGVSFDPNSVNNESLNKNHFIPMTLNENSPGNPLYCVPIVKSILINNKIYLFYLSNMFNNTNRQSGQHYYVNCSIMDKNKNVNNENIWFNQITHKLNKFYLSIDGYSSKDVSYPAIPFSYGLDCIQYDTTKILIIFYFNGDKKRSINSAGTLSTRESFLGSIMYDTVTDQFLYEQNKDASNNNMNLGFYSEFVYSTVSGGSYSFTNYSYVYDINILLKKTPNGTIKIIVPYNNTENGINIGSYYNNPSQINNYTDVLIGNISFNGTNIIIDLKTPNNYSTDNVLKIYSKLGNFPQNLKNISDNICIDGYYIDDTTLNLAIGSNNTHFNNTTEYLCFLEIKTETNNNYNYQINNCVYINTNSKKVNKVKIGKNNGSLPFIVYASDQKLFVTKLDTSGNFSTPYYIENITLNSEILNNVNNFFDVNTISKTDDYVIDNVVYTNATYNNPYKYETKIFNNLISYVSVGSVSNLSAINYAPIITVNPFILISFTYNGVFTYFRIKVYENTNLILEQIKTTKSFTYLTSDFSNNNINNLSVHVTPVLSNLIGNTIIANVTNPETISLNSPIIDKKYYHDISFNLPAGSQNFLTSIEIYRYENSSNTPPSNVNELTNYSKIKTIPYQSNLSVLSTNDSNLFLRDNYHYWYKLALKQNVQGITTTNPSSNYLQISTPNNLIADPSLNVVFNSSNNIFKITPIPIDSNLCTGFDIIIDTSNNGQNISQTISLQGNTDLSYNYQFSGTTDKANIKIKQKFHNYISDNSFNTIIPCPISPSTINSIIDLSTKIITVNWNSISFATGYDIYYNIKNTDYFEVIKKTEDEFNLKNETYSLLFENTSNTSYSFLLTNEQAWYSFKIKARYPNGIISELSENHSSVLCMICNQLFISDELKNYKRKIYGNNAGRIPRNEQWVRMANQRYYNKRISFNER